MIKYHHESTSNDLEYYGSVETDCKTLAERHAITTEERKAERVTEGMDV